MSVDIDGLIKLVDNLVEKVEFTGNIFFVIQFNFFRRIFKEKVKEFKILDSKLEEKFQVLKNC